VTPAAAFSHRFVILGFAISPASGLLAAMVHLVDRCPRAPLRFIFRKAALNVPLSPQTFPGKIGELYG